MVGAICLYVQCGWLWEALHNSGISPCYIKFSRIYWNQSEGQEKIV